MNKRLTAVLATIVVVIVVLAFSLNSLLASNADLSNQPSATPTLMATPSSTPIPVPIDFSIDNTSITVNVDLNNGMDRVEAILVAEKALEYAHNHETHQVESAEVTDGIWEVSLPWGAVMSNGKQESHDHYFVATIDPIERTVAYSTCF